MSLFDWTKDVRATDPETSRDAAKLDHSIDRERVREIMMANPQGLTDWEIAHQIDPMRKGSLSKRRHDLRCVPVLGPDDKPIRRSGCRVWRLPSEGE